jgi:hypothetical protein
MMIPTTIKQALVKADPRITDRNAEKTRANVARYAGATPQLLEQRLNELDAEWDVERVAATVASLTILGGLTLAVFLGEGWLAIPFVVAALLLLHALIGWSPIRPLIRKMGCRTAREIDHERYALKALRGDFQRLDVVTTSQDIEDLARFEGEGGPAAPLPGPAATHPVVVDQAVQAAQP